jgi:hypothetical protein
MNKLQNHSGIASDYLTAIFLFDDSVREDISERTRSKAFPGYAPTAGA